MENQALRDLLLALRNIPQTIVFSDVPSKVRADFKEEIDRILKSLDIEEK